MFIWLLNEHFLSLIDLLNNHFKHNILVLYSLCLNHEVTKGQDLLLWFHVSSWFLSHIVFQINFLRSFSLDISFVGCLLVYFCWPYQHSLILILVLGCDCNFYGGQIQIRHSCLLPLHTWGRSWWGCLLGKTDTNVNNLFLLTKNILWLHFPIISLLIVNLCVFCLMDHILLILKLFLGCYLKFSMVHIQIVHMNFLTTQVFRSSWQKCQFCDYNFHH